MTSLFANAVLGSAESSGSGSSIFSLGLLLLVPFGMYFFLIRPQRRKLRDQQVVQSALGVGDEIITTSGIFGTITGEDGEGRFWLEIDDDVQIRIARAAIQGRTSEDDEAESDDTEPDDADSDDADASTEAD